MIKGDKVYNLDFTSTNKLIKMIKEKPTSVETETMLEMTRAGKVAKKIARGEILTLEEERFISDKYPNIKRKAKQAKLEGETIKERVRQAKSLEDKKQIILSKSTEALLDLTGEYPKLTGEIKISVINKVCEDEGFTLSDIDYQKKKGNKINSRA
ncbi:MAG: hypothetical protein RR840_03340 [Clostridium sp.]